MPVGSGGRANRGVLAESAPFVPQRKQGDFAIVDTRKPKENGELFEITAVNQGARPRFLTSTVETGKWLVDGRRESNFERSLLYGAPEQTPFA
jgi:hypothetical protein